MTSTTLGDRLQVRDVLDGAINDKHSQTNSSPDLAICDRVEQMGRYKFPHLERG